MRLREVIAPELQRPSPRRTKCLLLLLLLLVIPCSTAPRLPYSARDVTRDRCTGRTRDILHRRQQNIGSDVRHVHGHRRRAGPPQDSQRCRDHRTVSHAHGSRVIDEPPHGAAELFLNRSEVLGARCFAVRFVRSLPSGLLAFGDRTRAVQIAVERHGTEVSPERLSTTSSPHSRTGFEGCESQRGKGHETLVLLMYLHYRQRRRRSNPVEEAPRDPRDSASHMMQASTKEAMAQPTPTWPLPRAPGRHGLSRLTLNRGGIGVSYSTSPMKPPKSHFCYPSCQSSSSKACCVGISVK